MSVRVCEQTLTPHLSRKLKITTHLRACIILVIKKKNTSSYSSKQNWHSELWTNRFWIFDAQNHPLTLIEDKKCIRRALFHQLHAREDDSLIGMNQRFHIHSKWELWPHAQAMVRVAYTCIFRSMTCCNTYVCLGAYIPLEGRSVWVSWRTTGLSQSSSKR